MIEAIDRNVHEAFAQAWHRSVTLEKHYVLAGQRARVRVAGTTLARCIDAPFSHLHVTDSATDPDLTIDLWDVDETGVAGPDCAAEHATGEQWLLDDGTLAASAEGRRLRHRTRAGTVWLDRDRRHIVGWFTDARLLPLHARARPLQLLLAVCASDRGIHAVHGALVARGGRGVLLAGDSGTGKSTAALSCVAAGFSYLGDDWIGVRRISGTTVGYSLYSSASLEPAHVARFPQLQHDAVMPDGAERKALLMVGEIWPTQLEDSATISAIALPRLTDSDDTAVHPAPKRDALLTMARSAICSMRPRGGRATIAALTRLAQDHPTYWLDIGRDLAQISQRLDAILAAAAP